MGKRKERRLAAKSNAGRRVKLDLFAEPSGDLGGSSVHDEAGEGVDLKRQAGSPNSPTSSGQQPENPLLLLGQYSDDELEEGSTERSDDATLENSLAENVDEVEKPSGEEYEGTEANATIGPAAEKVKQHDMENDCTLMDTFQNLEGHCNGETDATTSGDLCKAMGPAEQVSIPGTADVQDMGEVIASGWKMVMHEESNQYYYWNTETGETSWEVPDILAHSLSAEKIENASVSTHELNSTLGVEFGGPSTPLATNSSIDPNSIIQSKGMHDEAPGTYELIGQENEAVNNENSGTDQNGLRSNFGAVNATSMDSCSTSTGSEKYAHCTRANEEQQSVVDVSSHILRQSECLLERLKALKGSKSYLQGHDWVESYILEVEIRLSDIKALSSYGASLLPFWVHSERQLKRLENIIDDEVSKFVKTEQVIEIKATGLSSGRSEDKIKKSVGHESEAHVIPNKTLTAPETHHGSSFGLPTEQLGRDALVSEQVSAVPFQGEFTQQQEFHAGEDIDMDVDMEFEDANPVGNSNIRDLSSSKDFAPLGPLVQPNQSADYPSLATDHGFTSPPPPEDEWIPPPPPDNDIEQIPPPPPPDNEEAPPPPPDEPPEPSYPAPPSHTETRQPLSYADLYSIPYPTSNYEYYGHVVTEASSNNFYGHADGSQVPMPHAPLYYESVPNTYVETAPVMVNPVDAVAYYGLQDGTVPSVPVISSIESSQLHTGSSHQFGSIAAYAAVSEANTDVSGVGVEAKISSTEAPSTATTIQESQAVSVEESVAAAAAAAAAPSKAAKSKVLRAKKRTAAVPSLRSNKKVSTLVDKWKAAKEELHEDEEDEPKSAYEILEKKRQREIEEWRAKQIASGEAKDNANFQPLGGDWRERVKRRRAQKASATAETSPQEASDRNEQPDLVQLSKNLPAGWQAYWDGSSKQVYFGNTLTSETTWTRPAK